MKKNILVYTLTDNGYNAPTAYTFDDKIKVNIYDNLEIDFNTIDIYENLVSRTYLANAVSRVSLYN